MERKISSLLNSCDIANLLSSTRNDISDLVQDYFCSDNPTDNGWSEEEEEDDLSDEDIGNPELRLTSDEEIDDQPLVIVKNPPQCTMDICGEEDMLTKAQTFSCNCNGKKIKASTSSCEDTRVGCIGQFTPQEIVSHQLSVKEMHRNEVDWMIVTLLGTFMRNESQTVTSKRKEQTDREKSRCTYCVMSRQVCRKTFLFLFDGMNRKRLGRLLHHVKTEGVVPPKLKSGGRKSNTAALSLDDVPRVVTFVENFAEENAVCLPGRVSGLKERTFGIYHQLAQKVLYTDNTERL